MFNDVAEYWYEDGWVVHWFWRDRNWPVSEELSDFMDKYGLNRTNQ
jgi:hypothetical protein